MADVDARAALRARIAALVMQDLIAIVTNAAWAFGVSTDLVIDALIELLNGARRPLADKWN